MENLRPTAIVALTAESDMLRNRLRTAESRANALAQELAELREAHEAEIADMTERLNRQAPLLGGTSAAPVDVNTGLMARCPECGYDPRCPLSWTRCRRSTWCRTPFGVTLTTTNGRRP